MPSPTPPIADDTRTARQPRGTLRVLKESEDAGVYLVREASGELVVVKRWRRTAWEWCKTILGIAQPQRQRRNARRLLAASIATPEPLGNIGVVRDAAGTWLELRLRWVDGDVLIDRVRAARQADLVALGRSMRSMLDRFARAGLFNRDAKLSNWIVTPQGELVAIDPVGVRRRRDPRREAERLAVSLACELTPDERLRAGIFLETALSTLQAG